MATNSNISKYVTIAALIGIVIGSFLVWATVSADVVHIDINGTDSGKDGTITLVLALLAMPCVFFQEKKSWLIWIGLVLAGLVLLIGIYDTLDISHLASDTEGVDVKIGIGLWIVDAAAVVALIAGFMSRYGSSAGPSSFGRDPVT
jgi:hypothetical protein